jgi:hypothetical protein
VANLFPCKESVLVAVEELSFSFCFYTFGILVITFLESQDIPEPVVMRDDNDTRLHRMAQGYI